MFPTALTAIAWIYTLLQHRAPEDLIVSNSSDSSANCSVSVLSAEDVTGVGHMLLFSYLKKKKKKYPVGTEPKDGDLHCILKSDLTPNSHLSRRSKNVFFGT